MTLLILQRHTTQRVYKKTYSIRFIVRLARRNDRNVKVKVPYAIMLTAACRSGERPQASPTILILERGFHA